MSEAYLIRVVCHWAVTVCKVLLASTLIEAGHDDVISRHARFRLGRVRGPAVADSVKAIPAMLTGAAATLHDLARELETGQFDLFLLDWANSPASHPDMAKAMRTFGEFAHDQYQDVVALLAALSTRVEAAASGYQHTDDAVAQDMTKFLHESTFVAADCRPK